VNQLRSKEVGEHEAKLQAWKKQTQEETQRHIQEREATLSEWSSRIEAKGRELDSDHKAYQVQQRSAAIQYMLHVTNVGLLSATAEREKPSSLTHKAYSSATKWGFNNLGFGCVPRTVCLCENKKGYWQP
jgi:hypothetical protein